MSSVGDGNGPGQLSESMRYQLEAAGYQGLATFAHRPLALSPQELDEWKPAVAIVGAPWDGSSSHRPGARFAPRALRANAFTPSTYHLDLEIEIFEYLSVVDYGDAICKHGLVQESHNAIRSRVSDVARRAIIPIVLGGDHSITWPAATAVAEAISFGNIGLLHFDAHADTADTLEGNPASHGTPMRRLIESGAIKGRNFVQIGLRGYWPGAKVFEWMREQNMEWHLMSEVRSRGLSEIVRHAVTRLSSECEGIYLSVDIDVLDPGFAPGTGTPEPGGMFPHELLETVRYVALASNLVAADIVEVNPPYDHAEVTINNAQRIVMEILAGLAARRAGIGPSR